MLVIDSIEEHLPPKVVASAAIVAAVVGYQDADDVATCLVALARSSARDFIVSIRENGEHEAYITLIQQLSGSVEQLVFGFQSARQEAQ